MPAKFLQFLWLFVLALTVLLCGCRATGPDKVWEAEELLREGKNAEALTLLQEAVQMSPRSAPAWNYLGVAYQKLGDHARAVQAYSYALTLDQNLAAAKLNLGLANLESGNYTAAAEALVTYTALRPHDTNGALRLAQAYFGQAKNVAAKDRNRFYDAVGRALGRAGNSPESLNMQGVLDAQRGRHREAYTNFVTALQKAPKYEVARLNLAVLHHGAFRDPAGALAIYKELYSSAPTGLDTFSLQRAIASLEVELSPRFVPPRADTIVTQTAPVVVVTNTPHTSAPPRIVITNKAPATNLVEKKTAPPAVVITNPPQAKVEKPPAKEKPAPPVVAKAKPEVPTTVERPVAETEPKPEPKPVEVATTPEIVLQPPVDTPSTVTNQVAESDKKPGILSKLNPAKWFDRKTGPKPPVVAGRNADPAPVNRPLTTNLPAPPQYPKYRYIGTFILQDGEREEARPHFLVGLGAHTDRKYTAAIAAYKRAIAADPRYFEAHHNLALAYMQAGDLGNALIGFEKALHLDPVSVEARYNFATALDAAGYSKDAADELERALAADPRSVKAHLFLARINADRLQNIPKAKEHYRKVIELDPRHPKAVDIRYWLAANP